MKATRKKKKSMKETESEKVRSNNEKLTVFFFLCLNDKSFMGCHL